MAIKFFCENPDCDSYKKMTTEGRVKYQMIGGHLIPEVKKCHCCKEAMSVQEVKGEGVPQISVGSFAMMTPDEKRAALKKRTAVYDKKNDAAGTKEYFKTKTINKFLKR